MTRKQIILHPFLLAIQPIAFLYSMNVNYPISHWDWATPLLISITGAIIAFTLLGRKMDGQKAGLVTSLAVILFYTYGHAYNIISVLMIGHYSTPLYFQLFITYLAILACFTLITWKTGRDLKVITDGLNIISIFLIAYPLMSIILFKESRALSCGQGPQVVASDVKSEDIRPDIYYIILDGYAHHDVLNETFGFDNTEFLGFLDGKGFHTPKDARTNYALTFLSLASSMNMQYHTDIPEKLAAGRDQGIIFRKISGNKVTDILRSRGYEFIQVSSGWGPTDQDFGTGTYKQCGLHEFQMVLLDTTLLTPFTRLLKRRGALCSFDTISKASMMTGKPVFVFAHILPPHPPFIFDDNGGPVPLEDWGNNDGQSWHPRRLYVKQLRFINSQLKELITDLTGREGKKPVIILQADHGPASSAHIDKPTEELYIERMRIFMSVYNQGKSGRIIGNRSSPVNIFPSVLNEVFNTAYDLPDDSSYYSTKRQPYIFINVTERLDAD
ncbi:sulfatase-like hydrolase/transferase [Candidatus Altiarchaeota archaeon]